MKLIKQLLLIFFAGLGIQRVVHDVLLWIDPELALKTNDGYFPMVAFLMVYLTIKYLKQRDAAQANETN